MVKTSRSYFSSYKGSPQTKVSGSSNKGAAAHEPDQIKKINKKRSIILFSGYRLMDTPYNFIRLQPGIVISRCINYKYPIVS